MPPGGLHTKRIVSGNANGNGSAIADSPLNDRATRNRDEIARALMLFETWLLDAYEKHDFHGDVIVKATFADAKMIMLYPSIEQKVRV